MVFENTRERPHHAEPATSHTEDLPRESTQEVVPEALPKNQKFDEARVGALAKEAEKIVDEKKENARKHATAGLKMMAEYLGPLMNEGTIMASTAMFLLAKMKREAHDTDWEKFDVPPGDVDIAVDDYAAFVKMREQLAHVPGIVFQRDGRFGTFKGQEDTKILAGEFPVTYEAMVDGKSQQQTKMYEFEIFYKTKIAPEAETKQSITYDGYRLLNPDSLLRQYEMNKAHEGRVDREVKKVVDFLTSPELQAFRRAVEDNQPIPELDKDLAEGIRNLALKRSEMERFYALQGAIERLESDTLVENSDEYKELQQAISDRATLLSNYKTKLWKRIKNVQQLAEEREAHAPHIVSPEQKQQAA